MPRDFTWTEKYEDAMSDEHPRVLDWKYIYIIPRTVTSDPHTRYVQYKVLNNVIYLNEKHFSFGISETSQYSFCNQNNETIEHLFCHCFVVKALWNGLNTVFDLSLYDLTPQVAFFGYTEKHLDNSILQNHLLLVFQIYLYKSRSYGFVCLKSLLIEIKKINCLEKKLQKQMQISIFFFFFVFFFVSLFLC